MNAGAAHGGRDAGGEIAVADQFDARAGFADLRDEIVMTLAIEYDDGQFVDVALECFGELAEVFGDGLLEIDILRGRGTDDELVHVDIGCVQQAALFGSGEDGDRSRRTGRAEVRAFERIDGDIDFRIDLAFRPAASQRLADVEHRCLVALSFADDDRAAHLEPVELFAHRLDCNLIRILPLAVTHRPRRGDGRFLCNAEKSDLETRFHDAPIFSP